MTKFLSMKDTYFFLILLTVACQSKNDYSPPVRPSEGTFPQVNATIRALHEAVGQSDTGFVQFTDASPLWVEGVVSSSDSAGNFYKELFLQDTWDTPRYAVRLLLDRQALHATYPVGRKLYVKINGLGAGFQNGVLSLGSFQVDRVSTIPEALIDDHVIRDTLQKEVIPYPISIGAFQKEHLGKFIVLDDVQFSIEEQQKTYAGETFDEYDGERRLVQCADYHSTWLLTSTYSNFKSQTLAQGTGNVKGILSRNYYDEHFVIKLNSPEAVQMEDPRCDPFYAESFETFLLGRVQGAGWMQWAEAGTQFWEVFRDKDAMGQSVRMGSYRSGDKKTIGWLLSPQFDTRSIEDPILSFRTSVAFGDASTLEVLISTNWDGQLPGVTSADWQVLPAALAHKGTPSEQWIDSGPLVPPKLPFHLAFVYRGSGKTKEDGTYELDDLRLFQKKQ